MLFPFESRQANEQDIAAENPRRREEERRKRVETKARKASLLATWSFFCSQSFMTKNVNLVLTSPFLFSRSKVGNTEPKTFSRQGNEESSSH